MAVAAVEGEVDAIVDVDDLALYLMELYTLYTTQIYIYNTKNFKGNKKQKIEFITVKNDKTNYLHALT